MNNIVNHREWCSAIFKYMLEHPQKCSDFNFRAEYLSTNMTWDFESKLFDAALKRVLEFKMQYNLSLLYISYFEDVCPEPDLKDAFYQPNSQDNDTKKRLNDKMSLVKTYYDRTVDVSSGLSSEFIESITRSLVYQQSISYKNLLFNKALIMAQSEDLPAEEFYERLEYEMDSLSKKYLKPDNSASRYINPFDNRLMIKITDKIYPTSAFALNDMLCGGFQSQSVTGFLTKTAGGKSTLLFTLAADFLRNGYRVCFVNLEMNDYETNTRIISAVCEEFDYKEILHNLTSEEYMNQVKNVWDVKAANGRYALLSNRGMNVSTKTDTKWLKDSVSKIENAIRNETGDEAFKFDIIIIDYLYLLDPSKSVLKNAQPYEKYRQITIEVHEYAQNDDYCIITVFQGNREAERKLNSGDKVTLAEAGDSYSSFRDIENAFSLSRYSDAMNCKDGCLIESLKNRNYDGEKYGIYLPYRHKTMSYLMNYAEKMSIEEERDEDYGKNKKRKEKPLTVDDVLNADPTLKDCIGGCITRAMMESNMVKTPCDGTKLKQEFDKRGWKLKNKSDFENPSDLYEDMKKKTIDAIKKAIGLKTQKVTEEKSVSIGINQFDIFSI